MECYGELTANHDWCPELKDMQVFWFEKMVLSILGLWLVVSFNLEVYVWTLPSHFCIFQFSILPSDINYASMAQAQECWQMTNKVCWGIWMVDFDREAWNSTLKFDGLFRVHTHSTRIVLSFDLIVFLRLPALTPRSSVVLPYTGPLRKLQWHPQEPQIPTDLVRLYWRGYIIGPSKPPPTSSGMRK